MALFFFPLFPASSLRPLCSSQLDQGCVIPRPTAEDITKRGVPPMSPPLAMWEKEAQVVELEKGEAGLGFSILDYQVREQTAISL